MSCNYRNLCHCWSYKTSNWNSNSNAPIERRLHETRLRRREQLQPAEGFSICKDRCHTSIPKRSYDKCSFETKKWLKSVIEPKPNTVEQPLLLHVNGVEKNGVEPSRFVGPWMKMFQSRMWTYIEHEENIRISLYWNKPKKSSSVPQHPPRSAKARWEERRRRKCDERTRSERLPAKLFSHRAYTTSEMKRGSGMDSNLIRWSLLPLYGNLACEAEQSKVVHLILEIQRLNEYLQQLLRKQF